MTHEDDVTVFHGRYRGNYVPRSAKAGEGIGRSREVSRGPLEEQIDVLRSPWPTVKRDRVASDEKELNPVATEFLQ